MADASAPVQRLLAAPQRRASRSMPERRRTLPSTLAGKLSRAFATDISPVEISEGSQASEIGAEAYTQGTRIRFAPGRFQPDTERGREVIGHEFAHVMQQADRRVSVTDTSLGFGLNRDRGLEHQADVAGSLAARGQPVPGLGGRSVDGGGSAGSAPVQRVFDTSTMDATANSNYFVDSNNRSVLYAKRDATPPAPKTLYNGKHDVSQDGAELTRWTPNVRFFSADQVSQNDVIGAKAGLAMNPNDDVNAGYSVLSKNDCYFWAQRLHYLIAYALAEKGRREHQQWNPQQSRTVHLNNEQAPDMGVGDLMRHKFTQNLNGCNYHAATVVAKDGASLITLEANVDSDLSAPEFYLRAGMSGFVEDNNEDADHGQEVLMMPVRNLDERTLYQNIKTMVDKYPDLNQNPGHLVGNTLGLGMNQGDKQRLTELIDEVAEDNDNDNGYDSDEDYGEDNDNDNESESDNDNDNDNESVSSESSDDSDWESVVGDVNPPPQVVSRLTRQQVEHANRIRKARGFTLLPVPP